MSRNMRRWRRTICPPRPASLDEYASILNSHDWKHLTQYNEGNISVISLCILGNCPENNDGEVTIMANIELLQTINFQRILVDATFDVCPSFSTKLQFLTIMAHFKDTVSTLENNESIYYLILI